MFRQKTGKKVRGARLLLASAILCALLLPGCKEGNSGADADALPKEVSELKGKKVGCLSGSLFEVSILPDVGDVDIMPLSSPAELLAALRTNKCDYVVEDYAALFGIPLQNMGCRIIFNCKEADGDYGFGLNFNDQELCNRLNAFIALLKENGTMDEIYERWTGEGLMSATMPEIAVPTKGDPLEIAIFNVNFPFGFVQKGDLSGLEVEIFRRFGAHIGRPVHFIGYDFASLTAVLSSGKADIISGSITITEERAEKILFSDPYMECKTVCIAKDEDVKLSKTPKEFIKDGVNSSLITEDRWRLLLGGLWETLIISFFSIIIGTLLGALICWMRMCRLKMMNAAAKVYLDFMRGIPMLVFLMLMFYVVLAATPFTATAIAIIAFAMNFGAFSSEIFRTGISSVDRGQTEAGLALGFTRLQSFIFIVLPQAVRKIVPVFKNEAVSLIKNTSIVGYIAIQDLTKVSDIVRSRTFDAFFPLILISIIYLLLAWLLGKALDLLNKTV